MKLNNCQQAFLALVRAGLWEEDVRLLPYGEIDFETIYRIAEEQAVLGLVVAGLEHVVDIKIQKDTLITFAGSILQLEQRNTAMNHFIEVLIKKLSSETDLTMIDILLL